MTIATSRSASRYGAGIDAIARSTRRSNGWRAHGPGNAPGDPRRRLAIARRSSAARAPPVTPTIRAMQVVHTERHRAHDPQVETYLGVPVPANEVPARADAIRDALPADGGFELVAPTEHGADADPRRPRPGPPALPRGGLAGDASARRSIASSSSPTPTRRAAMFEGMSDELVAARPEPIAVGGRAGWWGLDSSNPIVAGTYDAARWRGGRRADGGGPGPRGRAGGVRAVPAARAPRGALDGRRLLLLQQRGHRGRRRSSSGDRGARRDPRRRRPPRQRHPADLLAPRGRAATPRSTRTRGACTRSSSATPTRSGRARSRREPQPAAAAARRRRDLPRGPRPGARVDRRRAGRDRRRLARLRHVRAATRSATSPSRPRATTRWVAGSARSAGGS